MKTSARIRIQKIYMVCLAIFLGLVALNVSTFLAAAFNTGQRGAIQIALTVGIALTFVLLRVHTATFNWAHGPVPAQRCSTPGCQVEITTLGLSDTEAKRLAYIASNHELHTSS